MGMKKQNASLMMYAMALASLGIEGSNQFDRESDPEKIEKVKNSSPKKPLPKGTKEYFFSRLGEFSTEQMLKSETVFKCYAINNKNAKKKFKAFLEKTNHEKQKLHQRGNTNRE